MRSHRKSTEAQNLEGSEEILTVSVSVDKIKLRLMLLYGYRAASLASNLTVGWWILHH